MRGSSSELLLEPSQESRQRKLAAALAPPRRPAPPRRSWRERLWFYATSALALTAVAAGSSLLFLVPLYVDAAISTLSADFVASPVRCITTRREDLCGIFNCTWSSCREGCTSDMFVCTHVYVAYTTTPYTPLNGSGFSSLSTMSPSENFTDEAVLYVNIKGCGYPPTVDCRNWTDYYGEVGREYPCYYSRQNRTVVMSHYERAEHISVIVHFFAVPFVVTLATSVVLCVMYCDCRCSNDHGRHRHRHAHSAMAHDYRYTRLHASRSDILLLVLGTYFHL